MICFLRVYVGEDYLGEHIVAEARGAGKVADVIAPGQSMFFRL